MIGCSCPIDSLTVKLINKRGWIGMSTGGEYQELFQKGRIGMSIGHEYPVTRERQKGVDDMNIKARYRINNGR